MKRGQLNISFGAIFSIIIIVATLAVAGYVIYQFVRGTNQVNCALFYDDFQKDINRAWASDGETSYIFSGNVPSGAEKVCFGFLSQDVPDSDDLEAYNFFKKINTIKENLYIYPKDACGDSRYKFEIKNAESDSFFCVDIVSGSASLRISKELGKKVKISEN
jgi:hypothetical protein